MVAIAQIASKRDRVHAMQRIIKNHVGLAFGVDRQGIRRPAIYLGKEKCSIVPAAHHQVQPRAVKGYFQTIAIGPDVGTRRRDTPIPLVLTTGVIRQVRAGPG
jgi:hypothetical protein